MQVGNRAMGRGKINTMYRFYSLVGNKLVVLLTVMSVNGGQMGDAWVVLSLEIPVRP